MVLFGNYFDTGGTQNDEWVIVTAGLVATAKKWSRFEERWQLVLEKEGVTQFHAVDFAHSQEEYTSWLGDEPRRAAFVATLIKEIKRGVNKVFLQGVVLPDYHAANQAYPVKEIFGGPYSTAQAVCLLRAWKWLIDKKGPNDRIRNLVEHGDVGQHDFRQFCKRFHLPEPAILPKLDETTEKRWLPFQACDLIAYEFRRVYECMASRFVPGPNWRGWRKSLLAMQKLLPISEHLIDAAYFNDLNERGVLPRLVARQ